MSADRERLSRALYEIHQPGFYYCGLTPEGERHLNEGGSIGPDGMSMAVGMKRFTCCRRCQHTSRPAADEWPCDTVKLLLEAGVVVPPEDLDVDEIMDGARFVDLPNVTVNVRPDRQVDLVRFGRRH